MPVWWPNDVFEWTALKNLSHRYDGQLGDSYSNCLRLAIVQGYEFYNKVGHQNFKLAVTNNSYNARLSTNVRFSYNV